MDETVQPSCYLINSARNPIAESDRAQNMKMICNLLRVISPVVIAVILSACGGGSDTVASAPLAHQAAALAITQSSAGVVSLTKVSETRVSRTVYDYVFKITVRNGPTAQTAIMATVTGAAQGTVILDGSVLVGDIAPGSSVTPSDTITLRVDRMYPFNSSALTWQITDPINGIAAPPEPDKTKNQATLAGIDTNGNGVRDDVERLVAANFGADPQVYADALADARTLQKAIVSPSPAASEAHINSFKCIEDTKKLTDLGAIDDATLDTSLRRRAYGLAFAGSYISNEGC